MFKTDEPTPDFAEETPDWTFEELVAAVMETDDAESHQRFLALVNKQIARGIIYRFPVTLYLVKRSDLPDPQSDGLYLPVDDDSCWYRDETGLYGISSSDYRKLVTKKKVGANFIKSWVWHRFTDEYRYLNTIQSQDKHAHSDKFRIRRGKDRKIQFVSMPRSWKTASRIS